MTKPIIGITLDAEKGDKAKYSEYPWYALRENYGDAISRNGGVPIMLPHEPEAVEYYLDVIQGLVITGGAFDVPPTLYGVEKQHEKTTIKARRTEFEYELTKGALGRNIPILGICGGEQLVNVILGGTLLQHIPDAIAGALEHEQRHLNIPINETSHSILIKEGTLLHRITGTTEMQVNSSHHQAVDRPGDGMVISAVAPDGVVEAVESPLHRFCLGVEWHPEYEASDYDTKILRAFVEACRG